MVKHPNLKTAIEKKISKKKKLASQKPDLKSYNILCEIGFAFALPMIISISFGSYYTNKNNKDIMLLAILIGFAFGIANFSYLIYREMQRLEKRNQGK